MFFILSQYHQVPVGARKSRLLCKEYVKIVSGPLPKRRITSIILDMKRYLSGANLRRAFGPLTLTLALLIFFGVHPVISALTPEEMSVVAATVADDDPDAMILEFDLESSRGGGIVSVETSRGTEYYVGLEPPEIIERERGGRGKARIGDRVAEERDTMDLSTAYGTVLAYLAGDERYSRIAPETFSSIEYEIEFGRLIVEVVFEGAFGELDVYMDPVTGEILESEWDD
jgi:hypothetical protein